MAKPIFIITLPKTLDREEHNHLEKTLSKKLYDYHVLVVQGNVTEVQTKCYYEKDFKEVNLKELKAIVQKNFM